MKVFISWSGDLSKKVALVWHGWLSDVIQNLESFMSAYIEKGARWPIELAKELEGTSYGLVCLTKDNWENPWVNFEAGALSKKLDESKCMTFLINLKETDIVGPLAQFQHTKFVKEEVKEMLIGLNAACKPCLTEVKLTAAFEKWWPDLEEKLTNVIKETQPDGERQGRSSEDILEELLELARRQDKLLKDSRVSFYIGSCL